MQRSEAAALIRALRVMNKANMDILKMLADLRKERERLGQAIIALERLAKGLGKRRGRSRPG
jgi:hypothetical protein